MKVHTHFDLYEDRIGESVQVFGAFKQSKIRAAHSAAVVHGAVNDELMNQVNFFVFLISSYTPCLLLRYL